MTRILNLIFCVASFAGIIASVLLAIQASQPCSGDGCMIRLSYILALIIFLFSTLIFYITLRHERLRYKKRRSNS